MARRRENMLEAFKASREQAIQEQREALQPEPASVRERLQRSLARTGARTGSKATAPPGTSSHGAAASGQGPLPVVPSGVKPSPPRALVDPNSPDRKGGMGLQLSPWVLVGYSLTLAILSFVLGWQLGGRQAAPTTPEVVHAGVAPADPIALPDPGQLPEGEGAWQEPEPTPDGEAGAVLTAADIAFEDPSNMYTLVIDQFNNNATGKERVGTLYHYLQGQGFPVIRPRLRGSVIYLLVGAGAR